MPREPKPRAALGALERRVMEVLWTVGPATPGEVLARLNARAGQPLAYTTAMTVLVRLAGKGFVERQAEGRRYRYRALATPDEVDRIAGRRELRRLLTRYGATNVADFAADLVPTEQELLARLTALASEEDEPA